MSLMGEEKVIEDFEAARRGGLTSISVDPISYPKGAGVLLGDAAHSMGAGRCNPNWGGYGLTCVFITFFQFHSTARASTAVWRMSGCSMRSSRNTRSRVPLARRRTSSVL